MKRFAFALLILGVLAGAVGTTLYTARDLDKLHDQVKSLELEVQHLSNENELLKTQVQTPEAQKILRAVKVECISPTDLAVQSAIKSKVYNDLSFLQGKPQDVLLKYPSIPSQVIDGQLVHIGTRKFRLNVTLVIIAHDELNLYVKGQLEQ